MGKKIFGIYLAKLDAPNSEAHARLELPASPLELHDAMDKVQLQENEELYLEIDDYYGFEYLAPHLMELDASLNELNDLAGRLAVLDETEQEAFDGLLRLEIQRKVESNGSILTMQDLRTLAVSAGADCCHVVGATSDAELGRFYAENGFMEELDGLSDDVFEMLDFGKIGKALRTGENGTFTRSGYVVKHSELVTAPPCAKELPEKPEYLFRLTLGLHPDLEDDRTVTLELPASAEALREVQKQLGADGWEGAMVLDYDGIIPQAAEFADLPMELDAFNDFAEAVEAMPSREKQIPKLKALLEHFEVTDLAMVDGDYKTKAYASVTIAGAFAVHGLRVIETDKGRFISMPQESYKKNGETVYNDTFHAVTAEARTALVDAVNDAYERRLQERMEQSEDAPAQGMEQQM